MHRTVVAGLLDLFLKKDGGERLDRVEKLKKLARFKDEQNNLVYIYIYRSLDCVHN
jgi:hypothetical protein